MLNFSASPHYWLQNAHIPLALLDSSTWSASDLAAIAPSVEGLACVDLEIQRGKITQIRPAGRAETTAAEATPIPVINLRQSIVFPCFVDMHTHLDKGHIWGRAHNTNGDFESALIAVQNDREKYWDEEDVFRRMSFGLRCSYAHGTQAIRTHIDAFGEQAEISFSAFKSLQAEWQGRLNLQAVSLIPLENFLSSEGEQLADLVAEVGGVLGGLVLMHENLDQYLDRVFILAKERGLDLDFHTDESGDPNDITLRHVARAALRHDFSGQIVCGHCCSLAVQPLEEVMQTMELVKQAKIGIVSLPMCNLYLQDRNQIASQNLMQQAADGRSLGLAQLATPTFTPRWRGVTLLHELKHYGIPVAVASDNCRDPFYGFGDHDMLEVLTQATRIAHLDCPYDEWCRTVTQTPARFMGLPEVQFGVGQAADLIIFKARYYSELLARPQHDRIVLRQGQAIDTTLPDYAELDDLLEGCA
jgi:cytosine/creatinine deaminase